MYKKKITNYKRIVKTSESLHKQISPGEINSQWKTLSRKSAYIYVRNPSAVFTPGKLARKTYKKSPPPARFSNGKLNRPRSAGKPCRKRGQKRVRSVGSGQSHYGTRLRLFIKAAHLHSTVSNYCLVC